MREVFNRGRRVDLLIILNAFSLPMHFPLAVALARVVEELGIPTIARHHDFWWERKRFLKSTMFPFFKRWFPPDLPTLQHVVINSIAQNELKKRCGIDSTLIWDTVDFASNKLNKIDSYSRHWRKDFGIEKDDLVFLQATRIVPRKRIELSIELLERLKNPNAVLVIAGHSGDEGKDYEKHLRFLRREKKVRTIFIGKYINSHRRIITTIGVKSKPKRRRVYTLWDCFVNADFVTYPTEIEGFGNQFVEAVYFEKPIILTPYPVYKADIALLGFQTVVMPGRVTEEAVGEVRELIANPKKRKNMTEKNFLLGKKHFSYKSVEEKLKKIFRQMKLPS